MGTARFYSACAWPSAKCLSIEYNFFLTRRVRALAIAQRVLGALLLAERWLDSAAIGLRRRLPWEMRNTIWTPSGKSSPFPDRVRHLYLTCTCSLMGH